MQKPKKSTCWLVASVIATLAAFAAPPLPAAAARPHARTPLADYRPSPLPEVPDIPKSVLSASGLPRTRIDTGSINRTQATADQALKYWTDVRLAKALTAAKSSQAAVPRSTPAHAIPAVGEIVFPGFNCTGTVVGWNLVLTAAHCVKPAGIPVQGFGAFVPMYENGHRPFGTWALKDYYIDHRRGTGDPRYDYALVSLRTNGRGWLGKKTGGYAISADGFKANETATLLGYPGDKRQPYHCSNPVTLVKRGQYKYWDVFCDSFTDGVSGTAWVHYEPSWKKLTIGAALGGYHDGGYGSENYASRWDSSIYSLWQRANAASLRSH